MNLPNKLTISRIIVAPVMFLWFLSYDIFIGMSARLYSSILLGLFLFAEITDLLDGILARKNDMVTDLGKIIDPLADVLCHVTFFIILFTESVMPLICVVVIIWREIIQAYLRMVMIKNGQVMASNVWGKAKTVCYAVTCLMGFIFLALAYNNNVVYLLLNATQIFGFFSMSLAVVSIVVYFNQVKKAGAFKAMTK